MWNVPPNGNKSIDGNLDVYGSLYTQGGITATLTAVSNSGTDYIGVVNADSNGQSYSRRIFIMFDTFTGFHRCFTNDELYNNDDPQKFKDDYVVLTC